MYIAAYLVTGFVMAGVYAVARLRGRWTRYERTAIVVPLMIAALAAPIQILVGDWAARTVDADAADQARRDRGPGQDDRRRAAARPRLVRRRGGPVRPAIPKPLSVLAFHDPRRAGAGAGRGPARDRPPVNVVRVAFQTMVGIGTLLAVLGVLHCVVRVRRRRLPDARGLLRGRRGRGPAVRRRARGRLGDDRGRPPALGRLRRDAHQRRGHRRRRHPGQLRRAVGALPRGGRAAPCGSSAASRACRSSPPPGRPAQR